jgi:hypothetical protein
MLHFIPLHLSAIERHPPLQSGLTSWLGDEIEFLKPSDCFGRGHDHHEGYYDSHGFWLIRHKSGTLIWMPPPGAAEVALEELRKARIIRQSSTHIFVMPRLLATEWRKQLHKAADLVIAIPAGIDPIGWRTEMYEPLTIGFVFPFLSLLPGNAGVPQKCSTWHGQFQVCLRRKDWLHGIFCGNFTTSNGATHPAAACGAAVVILRTPMMVSSSKNEKVFLVI